MSRSTVQQKLMAGQDGIFGEPEVFLDPGLPTSAEDISGDSEAQRGVSTPSARGERLCALNVQRTRYSGSPKYEGVGDGSVVGAAVVCPTLCGQEAISRG